ncbi:MAG: hypothetical protein E6H66_05775 [Betaproteobacteria bacterium]|nr:MAG: hypothetical protein E6H66_05775 [Betaproteobacteria bacterium]
MQGSARGWKVFDSQIPILTCEYSFGPGSATALAVGGSGGLVVVSPPCRVSEAVFDDLSSHGAVRALVASNAFHYLGMANWKAHFPDAALFAPAQSIARVEKHSRLSGIRPLAEATAITCPGVDLIDMPHYKTGEALVRIRTDRGIVWYVTDVIMNLPSLPSNPIIRTMFRMSRSAPGLKFNNIAPLFMMADKTAVRRWLADEFRKAPPRWLIAAHGDIVDFSANPNAQALFGV